MEKNWEKQNWLFSGLMSRTRYEFCFLTHFRNVLVYGLLQKKYFGSMSQLLKNSQLALFNGCMERLKRNFYSLGYYCTPNISIHQNSTQELTWNFLVTLKKSLVNFFYSHYQMSRYVPIVRSHN